MQSRGDAERLEIRRLAAADPVGILDQLGHDQSRGKEGEGRPTRDSADQLQRSDDKRGQAEPNHGGVRGQRAHVIGYRYAGRFSFKALGFEASSSSCVLSI